MVHDLRHIKNLHDRFLGNLDKELTHFYLNGDEKSRYDGNLNISFDCVEGESLIMGVKEMAISSGSACTSASLEPSYVLRAIGVGEELAHTSMRIGFGRFTTVEEIDIASGMLIKEVKRLRDMSPLWDMV